MCSIEDKMRYPIQSSQLQALNPCPLFLAIPWTVMTYNSSVQLLSCVWLFVTPWTAACQGSLSSPTHRVYPNSCPLRRWCLQPSHPLSSLLLPPSILPSIRVFSNESILHIRWPQYWSFSFSISPSNEHSGLISFRMDWMDLFAVQGTLKSLTQHLGLVTKETQNKAAFE